MTTLGMPPTFQSGQVQTRRAEVIGVTDDEGLVEARIIPYEVEVQLGEGLWEVFTRGAFQAAVGNPSRCKVTDQGHQRQVIIGHATQLRDEPGGLEGQLRIADTSHGRDVLALMRAGSLSELSAEFRPQARHMQVTRRAAGGVLVRHDRAVLVGVSPVGLGAYGEEARVLSVREAESDKARELLLAQLAGLTSGPRKP
jgi:HK97 family phage prohead protease